MRWQPFAVAGGFALPPLVLAVLVWPTGASADDDGTGGSDDEIEAELAPGDSADGTVERAATASFLVTGDGDGAVVISVIGPGFDPTLTITDPDSGESLDFNDDANGGLDPQLLVELDDGESVVAEVRALNGEGGGSFTILVDHEGEVRDVPEPGVPVPLPIPVPPTRAPGPPTTVPG